MRVKKKSIKLKKKKIEREGGPYDYCMFLEAAVKILPGTAAGADPCDHLCPKCGGDDNKAE